MKNEKNYYFLSEKCYFRYGMKFSENPEKKLCLNSDIIKAMHLLVKQIFRSFLAIISIISREYMLKMSAKDMSLIFESNDIEVQRLRFGGDLCKQWQSIYVSCNKSSLKLMSKGFTRKQSSTPLNKNKRESVIPLVIWALMSVLFRSHLLFFRDGHRFQN